MSAPLLLSVFSYVCLAIFAGAVLWRVRRQLRMPVHLRWEIYPVGHEPAAKRRYGGSYMEEPDWWTRPRATSLLGEATIMGPEILLLSGVWHHNRRLWWVSFPFHFGLYLLIALIGLIGLGGLVEALGGTVGPGAAFPWNAVYYMTILVGFLGYTLAFAGAVGLLVRRLTDPALRDFTAPLDLANLGFFIIVFATGLAAWLFVDHSFAGMRSFARGLLTLDPAPVSSGLVALAVLLGMALVAYIPWTHMSHFFMKYFLYHRVRWEDAPNLRGGTLERKIGQALQGRPTWSAPHVGADGKKTWVEIATSSPIQEGQ